jgi:hypothetical protein
VNCYRCINQLANFLTPILKGIREMTGLNLICFAGGPMLKYGGEIGTVQ